MMLRKVKSMIGQRSRIRLAWHHGKAFLAALRYGFPARKLTIVGITGTDGKTTTVGMVSHILQENGKCTGALTTAFFDIDGKRHFNETQKTSPSPFVIQAFLRKILKAGCTHAVLEYSSHGLVQGRTHYTWPAVSAMTNTSPEHLDYHGTMEQYRADKGILFRMLRGKGVKVLNREDGTYETYQHIPSRETITYALSGESTLHIRDVHCNPEGSTATVVDIDGTEAALSLHIPGEFNIENALCAIACAKGVGIALEKATAALQSFKGAPGRMEKLDEGQNFSVFVDFTVTPGAYQKTLSTLRSMVGPDKQILVLCGSCGDRMKEKRPLVGKVCSKLADVVIVTNEDPYTEDPEQIIDQVYAGIEESACHAEKIFDRRKAIETIFSYAKEGDAVILCAKGSDTTMWTAQGQIPWNEREIARELLRSRHE